MKMKKAWSHSPSVLDQARTNTSLVHILQSSPLSVSHFITCDIIENSNQRNPGLFIQNLFSSFLTYILREHIDKKANT